MIPPPRTVLPERFMSALALSRPSRIVADRAAWKGTRELPLPPLPFIVVYRTLSYAVEIANIIHGAQRWP